MYTSKKNVLLALLTGAAIGGVIGILYAPESGLKTRQKIKSKTLETSHELSEKIQHVKEDLAKTALEKKMDFERKLDEVVTIASRKADDVIVGLEEKLEILRKQNERLQKSS